MLKNLPSQIVFSPGGPLTQTIIGPQVGTHAGDNYIIKAIANNGEPNNDVESKKLTVWRRLWVECDAMPYFTEFCDVDNPNWTPSNPYDVTFPPSPAGYLGLASEQLAHACVTPVVYTPNTHQPAVGHNPMTDEDILRLPGAKINPQTREMERDPLKQPDGRDLYGNSSAFWTVRMVMTSQYGGIAGTFLPGLNTILICYEAIKDKVGSWNINHSAESVTVNNYISRCLLHETCHLLIDKRENDVDFSTKDTTTTDKSTIGIRDTIWRTSPGKPDEPYLYNRILYNTLLVGDIREIQQYSRARD